jgi:hypothetical protein
MALILAFILQHALVCGIASGCKPPLPACRGNRTGRSEGTGRCI